MKEEYENLRLMLDHAERWINERWLGSVEYKKLERAREFAKRLYFDNHPSEDQPS